MTDPSTGSGQRLEQRLAEVLTRHAGDAPSAHGLADAARTRARRRRRTLAAGAGAAVVLAVAVPTAVVAWPGGAEPGPTPSGPVADDTGSPRSDLRWESFHGVSVQVPDSWGYGSQFDWCADGGALTPRVQRPSADVRDVKCSPDSTYGVSFQEMQAGGDAFAWPVAHQDGNTWPEENAVGARGLDGVLITVAAPDAETAQAVLDSAVAYGHSDPNGCMAELADDQELYEVGTLRVCRYDPSGLLEQSEVLRGDDAVAAASALDTTPQGQLDCQPAAAPQATIEMYGKDHDNSIALDGACTTVEGWPDGIATADVLYWALSPGWTGDATGLPLPPHLREE